MKVEKIIKTQQPDMHKRLKQQNSNKNRRKGKEEQLSFLDILSLMKHDSYYRHRGVIRKKVE